MWMWVYRCGCGFLGVLVFVSMCMLSVCVSLYMCVYVCVIIHSCLVYVVFSLVYGTHPYRTVGSPC